MKKRALFGVITLVVIALGALWAWNRFSVQHEERSGLVSVYSVKKLVSSNPDDFATVVFVLHNLSDHESSYELRAEPPQGWALLDELQSVTLGAQAQQELFLTVQVPPATPPGRYVLSLRAQSDSAFAIGHTQIEVRERERLTLALASSDLIVHPNEEKTVTLTVTNRGNASARVSLAVTAAPAGWQFQLREGSLTLSPNQGQSVALLVKPLPNAEIGPGRFTVQATSSTARDELSFTVVLSP